MTRTRFSALMSAVFGMGALVGGTAAAATVSVTLSGADEAPAVNTMAKGQGKITVADDGTISGAIITSGMTATMAHIHVGAAGSNGPPIMSLSKKGDTFEVPAGAKLDAGQLKSFKAGELYINVHSAAHMSGEIRGQLK